MSKRKLKRACVACARVKERCDGLSPCGRCTKRDQPCEREEARPSKRQLQAPLFVDMYFERMAAFTPVLSAELREQLEGPDRDPKVDAIFHLVCALGALATCDREFAAAAGRHAAKGAQLCGAVFCHVEDDDRGAVCMLLLSQWYFCTGQQSRGGAALHMGQHHAARAPAAAPARALLEEFASHSADLSARTWTAPAAQEPGAVALLAVLWVVGLLASGSAVRTPTDAQTAEALDLLQTLQPPSLADPLNLWVPGARAALLLRQQGAAAVEAGLALSSAAVEFALQHEHVWLHPPTPIVVRLLRGCWAALDGAYAQQVRALEQRLERRLKFTMPKLAAAIREAAGVEAETGGPHGMTAPAQYPQNVEALASPPPPVSQEELELAAALGPGDVDDMIAALGWDGFLE